MWDFLLVLGQIPGTNIQITFTEIMLALWLAILIFASYKRSPIVKRRTVSYGYLKGEILSLKRSIGRRQIEKLRGIPAAKVHIRHRTA